MKVFGYVVTSTVLDACHYWHRPPVPDSYYTLQTFWYIDGSRLTNLATTYVLLK